MADDDNPAGAAARLEQALDRIARLARTPQQAAPQEPEMARIAARLDAVIAELRAALAQTPSA